MFLLVLFEMHSLFTRIKEKHLDWQTNALCWCQTRTYSEGFISNLECSGLLGSYLLLFGSWK